MAVINGTNASDNLNGTSGDDLIIGKAGDDTLSGGNGDDLLLGGSGDDELKGGKGDDLLFGGSGDDELKGGKGDDLLFGGSGDDTLKGGSGDDFLVGGSGDDLLKGGKGDDVLLGGSGDDKLVGGQDDDLLLGGSGDDILKGSEGDDLVFGNSGDDTAIYVVSKNAGSQDYYDGNSGTDTLRLVLSQAEFNDAAIQADIQAFQAFLAANSNPSGNFGPSFQFTAFDLTVRNFEALDIKVVGGGANQDPTAVADSGAADEDGPAIAINLTANDTDPDAGDDLEIQSIDTTGTLGSVSINPDGDSVTYDPNGQFDSLAVGQQATDTFSYTVTDGNGGTSTASVEVTITGQNDGPQATVIGSQSTDEDDLFGLDLSASFSDPDAGDVLTYSAELSGGFALPAWLSINSATGVLSGTPSNADVGVLTIDVTATDLQGAALTQSFQLTIDNTNDAPFVAVPIGPQSVDQDAVFSLFTAGTFDRCRFRRYADLFGNPDQRQSASRLAVNQRDDRGTVRYPSKRRRRCDRRTGDGHGRIRCDGFGNVPVHRRQRQRRAGGQRRDR